MTDFTGRIFALVDLLQAYGRMTTAELARRLDVSERTIRRDVARLHDLDVHVSVTPGRGGGVSIEPGSLLAPLRFTDNELLALLLGLRSVTPSEDDALARGAGTALKRLDGVLTPRARARAHALAAAVSVAPGSTARGVHTASERVLEMAESIHQRRRVRLRYATSDGTESTRDVDPYGLVRIGNWYVAGYCHLRRDLRTFRLDRVRSFAPSETTFEAPAAFDALAMVAGSLAQAPASGSIVCRVQLGTDLETASRHVPPALVLLEPDGDGVLLTVRAYPDELERIALHLLGMPWSVAILAPPELRDALRGVGERAIRLAC
ncbi:YafY family protein [soil metagenome]|nr:WYL domain-containing protein [Trueperaceae bacterium]